MSAIAFLSLIFIQVIAINASERKGWDIVKADGCLHDGYHYQATAPNDFEAGNQEFWACCTCHEVFLIEPLTGNFATRTLSQAIGFGAEHVAYLAPTMSVWDGTTAAFVHGNGTSAEPYLIESAANLAFLRDKVNVQDANYVSAYYRMETGVDLNDIEWVSIANTGATAFRGNFDGAGHHVIGLKVTSGANLNGLFGHLVDAYVANLDVTGDITASAARNGIVAGCVDYSTLENCVSRGTITAAGAYCGGICGVVEALDVHTRNNTQALLKNCINYASVTGNAASNSFVGGITGQNTIKVLIENCENYGHVQGAARQTAGIIGLARAVIGTLIKGCYNFANIDATGKPRQTGGIVGTCRVRVENCYGFVDAKINDVPYNVANLYPTSFGTTVPGGVICGQLDAQNVCNADTAFINCGGCDANKNPV
jgi:hypothetical protein